MKRILVLTAVLLLASSAAFAQSTPFGASAATTLSVTVGAEASISVLTNTPLASSTIFGDYTGTTNFLYKVRTGGSVTGSGVTLKITTDFSPAAGPSVANSGTTGDTLKYTCSAASSATACSGSQTSSTTAGTSVATFGVNAHSAIAGDSGSVAWDLVNDPAYAVGTYSATAQFTISAT